MLVPLPCATCKAWSEACLPFRIIGGEIHEHADAPAPLGLLRVRRKRPRGRRAAECG